MKVRQKVWINLKNQKPEESRYYWVYIQRLFRPEANEYKLYYDKTKDLWFDPEHPTTIYDNITHFTTLMGKPDDLI